MKFAKHHVSPAAACLCAMVLLGPAQVLGALPAAAVQPAKGSVRPGSMMPTEDVGSRVKRLHDQLRITPDQEAMWAAVAGVMQDNAAALVAAMQARQDKLATMDAVDDIQSYATVADAHATGLKKLAAAFAPLYAAMPPAQQQNANLVFENKPASRRPG